MGNSIPTPLMNAIKSDPIALQRLVDAGESPIQVNSYGWTPLHYAAQCDQPESIKVLVSAGGNVNAVSYYSMMYESFLTPLQVAARERSLVSR